VCGNAAKDQQTYIIEDVGQFDGHIACDSNSQSEIVVPIIVRGKLWGVLDIDSPSLSRFDDVDKTALEKVIDKFVDIAL
jgi:GAF domain-containing protein